VTALLRRCVLALAAVCVVACGTGGDPDVRVLGDPQAAEPVAGSSQIALTLVNEGDGDDTLVDARTDAALGVELHRSEVDDGRATMEIVDEIELPAGEEVRFRPGQTHLMLVVPDETVRAGGTLDLVLDLDRSGEMTVVVDVVDLLDLAEDSFDETVD
jgi:periplasmic copper chaperone A